MDKDDTRVAINMIRFMNHYARDVSEKQKILEFFKRGVYTEPRVRDPEVGGMIHKLPDEAAAFKSDMNMKITTDMWLGMMNDYIPVGYANTLGYAHPNSGDTMTTVMIGGLRTVMNGDFEIFAGDLVQFYW